VNRGLERLEIVARWYQSQAIISLDGTLIFFSLYWDQLTYECNLRLAEHVDDHSDSLNTISEYPEPKGEARIEPRERDLNLDEELSLLYKGIS
jgi:hypothetical protein